MDHSKMGLEDADEEAAQVLPRGPSHSGIILDDLRLKLLESTNQELLDKISNQATGSVKPPADKSCFRPSDQQHQLITVENSKMDKENEKPAQHEDLVRRFPDLAISKEAQHERVQTIDHVLMNKEVITALGKVVVILVQLPPNYLFDSIQVKVSNGKFIVSWQKEKLKPNSTQAHSRMNLNWVEDEKSAWSKVQQLLNERPPLEQVSIPLIHENYELSHTITHVSTDTAHSVPVLTALLKIIK